VLRPHPPTRRSGHRLNTTWSTATLKQLDPEADGTARFGSRFSATPGASSTPHSRNSTTTSGCSTLRDSSSLGVNAGRLALARLNWRIGRQLVTRLWHARSSGCYRAQLRRREGRRQVVRGRPSVRPCGANAWLAGRASSARTPYCTCEWEHCQTGRDQRPRRGG